MTEVKVKTELPDDYIQEVIWQGEAKEEKKAISKDGTTGDVPAEICVVIGGVRNQQTLGERLSKGSGWGLGGNVWQSAGGDRPGIPAPRWLKGPSVAPLCPQGRASAPDTRLYLLSSALERLSSHLTWQKLTCPLRFCSGQMPGTSCGPRGIPPTVRPAQHTSLSVLNARLHFFLLGFPGGDFQCWSCTD